MRMPSGTPRSNGSEGSGMTVAAADGSTVGWTESWCGDDTVVVRAADAVPSVPHPSVPAVAGQNWYNQ